MSNRCQVQSPMSPAAFSKAGETFDQYFLLKWITVQSLDLLNKNGTVNPQDTVPVYTICKINRYMNSWELPS